MPIQDSSLNPTPARTSPAWRDMAWRIASNSVSLLLGAVVCAYFLLALLFLGLRHLVLPNIEHYRPDVERVASSALGARVTIGGLDASWRGLMPHLELRDVAVRDPKEEVALRLPQVSATVSWWSIPAMTLRLDRLELKAPQLDARRDRDGNLYVAGLPVKQDGGEGKGADWVLSQHRIVIRDATVRWTDELRGAPELTLDKVQLLLRNRWTHHQIGLQATPPASYASPLDIRADFSHSPFSRRIADVSRWNGLLYLNVAHADIEKWNAFIDLPVAITSGRGALRAWMEMRQAAVVDLLVDVALDNVGVRFAKELPPLELAQVDGRIAASETGGTPGVFSFGSHGHRVTLSDFSLRSRSGLTLPPTTIAERYRAGTGSEPSAMELRIGRLDLRTLAELAVHLPLPEKARRLLTELSPAGELQDLALQWEGEPADLAAYRARGRFRDLSMRAVMESAAGDVPPDRQSESSGRIPGFRQLAGSFDLNESGGRLNVAATDAVVDFAGILKKPEMPLDAIDMQVRWNVSAHRDILAQIDRLSVRQGESAAELKGSMSLPGSMDHRNEGAVADLTGTLDKLELKQVGDYLPVTLPIGLQEWLGDALQGGRAQEVAWRLKGSLSDFPFRTAQKGAPSKGDFHVSGKINRGVLDFAPGAVEQEGRSLRWPAIEQIDGRFAIDRTRLEITAERAVTHGFGLSKIQAVVPDLLSDQRMLTVQGAGAGEIDRLVDYVRITPISGWTGRFLDDAQAAGPARLELKLQLPLARLEDSKVDGTLHLAGNRVRLMEMLPPLTAADGKITFSDKGFQLQSLQAAFLGGAVSLSGGSRPDGRIAVQAEGRFTVDGLRQDYAAPAMQRLLGRLTGEAAYTTTVLVDEGRPAVAVRSDLRGVGIDLPAPLNKQPGTVLPLLVDLTGRPRNSAGGERDELRVALGSSVEARYLREKQADRRKDSSGDSDPENEWRVTSGGIGINAPAPLGDSGLIASVDMPVLDIDEWRAVAAFLGGKTTESDEEEPTHAVAAVTAREPRDNRPAPEPSAFAQYVEPTILAARAKQLLIMGKKLDDVVVGASHADRVWQANIDSAQASGYLTWAESKSGRGAGKITARLATLAIPETTARDVADLLQEESKTVRIPALDIFAEDFRLFGKQFGQLDLSASNVRGTRGREWRIDRLLIANTDATLKASGRWLAGPKQGNSALEYELQVVNAGHLLDRLGFPGVLSGGKGVLDGRLNWAGMPFSFDIPTLSGALKLDMQAGQFLKVEPGAAKLLGVLSLQSLPRRLVLDFRDVFSEGFAFDSIVGTAAIQQGKAVSDNLKMRSVNATVLMEGSADLSRETQDLHVAVIPKINAGAASLVYGLAVNPVVGVGTFLAQLFLRDPLSRAFTFEYRVTGPWKDPVVTKLPRSNNATDDQAPERSPAVDQKTG